jgi:hypothetical protein
LEGNRASLLNLACVSRALSEVAFDELWSKVDDLHYLVALLPQDACQITDEDSDSDSDDDSIVSAYYV